MPCYSIMPPPHIPFQACQSSCRTMSTALVSSLFPALSDHLRRSLLGHRTRHQGHSLWTPCHQIGSFSQGTYVIVIAVCAAPASLARPPARADCDHFATHWPITSVATLSPPCAPFQLHRLSPPSHPLILDMGSSPISHHGASFTCLDAFPTSHFSYHHYHWLNHCELKQCVRFIYRGLKGPLRGSRTPLGACQTLKTSGYARPLAYPRVFDPTVDHLH